MHNFAQEYRQRDIVVRLLEFVYLSVATIVYVGMRQGLLPAAPAYVLVGQLARINSIFLAGFALGTFMISRGSVSQPRSIYHKLLKHWLILLTAIATIWLAGSVALYSPLVFLASWQLPLLGGIVFGYYNPQVTTWWYGVGRTNRKSILVLIAAAAVVGLTMCSQSRIFAPQPATTLPLGVIILAACWVIAGYHGLKYIEGRLAISQPQPESDNS